MRKILETLQGFFNPHFNSVPALPMGNVPGNELNLHQEDLDREFAGYHQRLTENEKSELIASHIKGITATEPTVSIDIPAGMTVETPDLARDFPGEVRDIEKVIGILTDAPSPVADMADDPNWKTHEPVPGKVVNDWVGEQTGPGAAFSKKIHNEFFATAWNWHRESAQNGKTNYHKHSRFFFMVGERVLNDDWKDIEKLSAYGFIIGRERDEMRAAVVVNDVSVQIDLTHIKAEIDRRASPWVRQRK